MTIAVDLGRKATKQNKQTKQLDRVLKAIFAARSRAVILLLLIHCILLLQLFLFSHCFVMQY